jgi:hypothetical protein
MCIHGIYIVYTRYIHGIYHERDMTELSHIPDHAANYMLGQGYDSAQSWYAPEAAMSQQDRFAEELNVLVHRV